MAGILQSYLSGFLSLSFSISWFSFKDERVETAVQSLGVEFGEQHVWVPPFEPLC